MKRLNLLIVFISIPLLLINCNVYRPSLDFGPEEKYVLFTFDDGPNNNRDATRKVLKVLKKHDVRAMFNLMGVNVDKYPEITREIHNDGHIIANHGYTVLPVIIKSRKKIRWEIDSCTAALRNALDDSTYTPKYFRPSMGWFSRRAHRIVEEKGMKVNGLTIYKLDTRKSAKDTEDIVEGIIKRAEKHNGGVIVLHDGVGPNTWSDRQAEKGRESYDRSFISVITDSVIVQLRRKGFAFPELTRDSTNDLSDKEKTFFKDIVY